MAASLSTTLELAAITLSPLIKRPCEHALVSEDFLFQFDLGIYFSSLKHQDSYQNNLEDIKRYDEKEEANMIEGGM